MGFFEKLKQGLSKTASSISSVFTASELDDEFYDDLEERLILADLGMQTTEEAMEKLRALVRERHIKTVEEAKLALREVLEGIVEIARRHQLMIFADEIYDRLCMDGYEHVSIASLAPDLPCVTFSGLSKSHMIAGYRIGWMVLSGNQRCMSDFIMGINMLSNMRLCSNVPAQSIVQTALGGHQSVNDYIRPGGRVYEQRNFVYEALNKIDGISVVKPRAAFYIFPKMDVKKFNITDDEQFALDLLHEKKILITRGGGFNWAEPDHFRIVYLPRMEVLKESLEDLADFFDHYRQS